MAKKIGNVPRITLNEWEANEARWQKRVEELEMMLMNNTLPQIIEHGAKACREHGFSFIEIYQTRNEKFVTDGWNRYIISPAHVSEKEYRFVGIVRADGTAEIKFP